MFLVAVAALGAYSNSLTAPMFLEDTVTSIFENEAIRNPGSLADVFSWPLWGEGLTVSQRPLLSVSFAVNFAVFGERPFGYRLTNVLIHIGSAMLVVCIAKDALVSRAATRGNAVWVSTAIGLVWGVHPLTSSAVTYIAQRAECMMALFFLAALHATTVYMRGTKSPWVLVAVALFASASAATKEVAVALPLVVLAYDRTFVSGTFRKAWGAHAEVHMATLTSWVVLGAVFAFSEAFVTHKYDSSLPSPLLYFVSQPRVLLHYFSLALYPADLSWDYDWAVATSVADEWLPLVAVSVFGIASIILFFRGRQVGFAGVAFFLLLAPSSSFKPTLDVIVEHRMYLPLILCVALIVVFLDRAVRRTVSAKLQRPVFVVPIVLWGSALLLRTVDRNRDYRSELAFWRENARTQPGSMHSRRALGRALMKAGRVDDALTFFRRLAERHPNSYLAHADLGMALLRQGRDADAFEALRNAYELNPTAECSFNMGAILLRHNRFEDAAMCFSEALETATREGDVENAEVARRHLHYVRHLQVKDGDGP